MNPGTPVMYGEPNGSWGVIVEANHYGGFYVRWNYGLDNFGRAITALSSVRPSLLMEIDAKHYAEHSKCRAWSDEQKIIREKELECQREKRKIRFL